MFGVFIIDVNSEFIISPHPNEIFYRTDVAPIMISDRDRCARWEAFSDEKIE
jgi:hypothetical protein